MTSGLSLRAREPPPPRAVFVGGDGDRVASSFYPTSAAAALHVDGYEMWVLFDRPVGVAMREPGSLEIRRRLGWSGLLWWCSSRHSGSGADCGGGATLGGLRHSSRRFVAQRASLNLLER